MFVGFTVVVEGPSVRVEVVPTPLVSVARSGPLAAAVMGRFTYRGDALARLPAADRDPAATPADLALATYRRLGARGLERLEGDFAVVVWDGAARTLVGLRDPMGGYPLHWAAAGGRFAVGTGMGRVRQLFGLKDLDREYLADFLTLQGQRHDGDGERTPYRGVNRVPAGSAVEYRPDTGKLTRRAYWDWNATESDPGADAPAAVAAALDAAVRERCVGTVSAHLSGGMDSTAVALRADRLGAGPVHTSSLVYHRLPKLAAERPYVEAGIARLTRATVERLNGDELLDFDAFADAPPHDEPYPGLWRLQVDRALTDAGAAAGADTILTGVGADELFDVHPFGLSGLIRRGRLVAAWVEAGRWAQALNSTRWVILKEFGLSAFALGRRLTRRATGAGLAGQAEFAPPAWVRPEFAREFDLPGRAAAQAAATFARDPDPLRSVTLSALACQGGDPVRWMCAAPRGVHIAHPFHDPRVIGLGLGVQRRVRPEPGKMKPVLATALADVLPPEITTRRAKGHFDEVYYRGLMRNLGTLERLVRGADVDRLGVIDKPALLARLEEAALGGPDARKLLGLELTLDAVKWLAAQAEWDRQVPAPAVVECWSAPVAEVAA